MSTYRVPELKEPVMTKRNKVVLVASGDLRLSADQMCWPVQEAMEKQITAAFAQEGITIRRGHTYDPVGKRGFISKLRS